MQNKFYFRFEFSRRNAGQLPVNFRLNRFGNILPYDRHRVTLDDDDGDDCCGGDSGDFYVNASHVAGYDDSSFKGANYCLEGCENLAPVFPFIRAGFSKIRLIFVVHLQGGGGRNFIAAQGPLAWTVDDFWRMVCHHRVETIVMLTECDKGE